MRTYQSTVVGLVITVLIGIGVAVPACFSAEPVPVIAEAADVSSEGDRYLIGPGDVLAIEVWKDPNLTRTVVVLPDGRISFPLIGELHVADKSVQQLTKEIALRLARYMSDTELTVEVKQSNSMLIYILGRVNNPGRNLLSSKVNVLQALAMAGGLNPFAKKDQIKIFRKEGGATKILPFSYDDVTNGTRLTDNIELKRGDVIFVP